jgi:hypothetical protein
MSTPLKDEHREVIPRWRSLRTTIGLGELTPAKAKEAQIVLSSDFLSDKLNDWHADRSLPFAS